MTDENLSNEMSLLDIPVETVPIGYIMSPEIDDVIDGSDFIQGMIVLLEDPSMRQNPEPRVRPEGMPEAVFALMDSPYAARRILETSRWCKVTKIRVYDDIVGFIGLYGDGTKMARSYHQSHYWLVKKSSVNGSTSPVD